MVRRHEHANHGYQAANAKYCGANVQIPCLHFVNYNTDCLDHAGLESFNNYVDRSRVDLSLDQSVVMGGKSKMLVLFIQARFDGWVISFYY